MTPVSAPISVSKQPHGTDRAQLAETAEKFEAIFLRQMLAAARKTDFGAPLLGGEGLKTFRTMQDEHFADIASRSGAFGLAAAIEAQLTRHIEAGGSAGASTGSARAGLETGAFTTPAQAEPVEAHALPSTQQGRK
jgi:flagellar protein FlgJ